MKKLIWSSTLLVLISITSIYLWRKKPEKISKDSQVLVENKKRTTYSPNSKGTKIISRFNPPIGYERTEVQPNSYGEYLRNLPLKKPNAPALFHYGDPKPNPNVYIAVVDLAIGKENLHQCADAIIRLRAEYLWSQGRFEDIHFNFTNGFNVAYSKWMNGYRIKLEGNNSSWVASNNKSNTYQDLMEYLNTIFMYAGTASLSKELQPVDINKMKIGDIFIVGGFPGHAITIVDMASNKKTKEKVFMLAQSYMPAQEIQILYNPNRENSPWYSLKDAPIIDTPEWDFDFSQLKRYKGE